MDHWTTCIRSRRLPTGCWCIYLLLKLSSFERVPEESPISIGVRISSPRGYLAVAALAALVTGCASTPPPAASTAQSPASAAELRELGDFTKKAQDEGWRPVVRHGEVLYCMNQQSLGSLLPTPTCLDKPGLERVMLVEERQRRRLQVPKATTCLQFGLCGGNPKYPH